MLYLKAPEAPSWIAESSRALEMWGKVWLALESTRINVLAHEVYVAQYCIAYADMREALEKMKRSKLVAEKRTVGVGDKAKTTVEKLTVSPFKTIYDTATREMERLGRFLGLDPTSPLDETKKFSDYAEILRYGNDDDDNDDGIGGSGGGAANETGVCTGAAGETNVLDERQDH